jgi:DNA-binding FadR family transcriptional regulator
MSDAEREHLCRCLAGTSAATPADYRRLDSRLHLAIAEVTGSPLAHVRHRRRPQMRLNELLDAIPLLERNIQHSTPATRRSSAPSWPAIPRAARLAMQEHLSGTAALLKSLSRMMP